MKKKYLRIANRNPVSARGYFPRRFLRVVGATTKRDQDDDTEVGGQFGSGKKFAPVAALGLDIELHITSHDKKGPYFYTYRTIPDPDGEPFNVVAMCNMDGKIEPLDVSEDACRNWQESIGDDPVRAYHVMREYVRDARDADPAGPHLSEVDDTHQSLGGTTSVYMTLTDEIQHMLKYKERYFKYLVPNLEPVYEVEGVGEIYPKSEKEVTRLFSQGSMAFCSNKAADATLYDYSFNTKKLLSEERNFRSLAVVRTHLAIMLASIESVQLVQVLLHAMISGKGVFETASLGYLGARKIKGAAAWRTAWQALWPGKDSVLSSYSHQFDDYAKTACKKNVVKVLSPHLRGFLSRCGVKSASDFYPKHLRNSKVVPATKEQQVNIDNAICILERHGFLDGSYEVFVYAPLMKTEARPDLGFCQMDGEGRGVYILQEMTNNLLDTLETLYHEFCHGRTKAMDGTRAFDNQKDADIGKLLLEFEGIPYPIDDEVASEFEIADSDLLDLFADEDTEPGARTRATIKSLNLIQRMIDEIKFTD